MTAPFTHDSTNKALNRLIRTFRGLDRQGQFTGGPVDVTNIFASAIPTVFVCSSTAPTWMIDAAQYMSNAFICDGTDDQEEMQGAVDFITSAGGSANGRVVLSTGEFYLSGNGGFALSSSQLIIGMGKDATLLYCTGVGSGFPAIAGGSGLHLRDLYLECAGGEGVSLNANFAATLDNVYIHSDEAGVRLVSNRAILKNVWITTDVGPGIEVEGGTTNGIQIEDSVIEAAAESVLVTSAIDRVGIQGTHLKGTHALRNTAAVGDLRMEGNDIEVTTLALDIDSITRGVVVDNVIRGGGIQASNSTLVNFNDNVVSLPGGHGFELVSCSRCKIQGNTIFEPGTDTDNTYDGIHLSGDSDGNTIDGNTIIPQVTFSPRYAINISASTCDKNRIGDNEFGTVSDFATGIINDAGTGTKYPTAKTLEWSQEGPLSIGQGVIKRPIPDDHLFIDTQLAVGTAPSGGPVTADVNLNGVTVYGTATNPSIADAAVIGSPAKPDYTELIGNDWLTVDLDAVNGAEDLTAVVRLLPI